MAGCFKGRSERGIGGDEQSQGVKKITKCGKRRLVHVKPTRVAKGSMEVRLLPPLRLG